jgi:AcrR family transcriptional regulator
MRTNGQRADAQDNRRRLIDAVGRLLARQGALTLTEVAVEAGVSRATTYRNFSTPEAAIEAFIDDFLTDFETAVAGIGSTCEDPFERLTVLCAAWGELVEERSHALIHVRSTEGFLARAHRGDPIIARIYRIVRAALDDVRAAGGLGDIDTDYAVFLWNLLLDPRELLDLAQHNGQSIRQATAQLTADYLELLRARTRAL